MIDANLNLTGQDIIFKLIADLARRPIGPITAEYSAQLEQFLQMLREGEVDMSAINDKGQTPLLAFIAENGDRPFSLRDFLMNIPTEQLNRTMLIPKTLNMKRPGESVINLELLRALIEAGASINERDLEGNGVLHLAIKAADEDLVNFLIENNAAVNAQDSDGITPLMNAVIAIANEMAGQVELKAINLAFWQALQDPNKNKVKSLFEIVKALLAAGADPLLADKNSIAPLQIAFQIKLPFLVFFLLKGAKILPLLNRIIVTGAARLNEGVVMAHKTLKRVSRVFWHGAKSIFSGNSMSADTAEASRQVMVLAGPDLFGGNRLLGKWLKPFMLRFRVALEHKHVPIQYFGDKIDPLPSTEISNFLESIRQSDKKITLIISAHGGEFFGHHNVRLGTNQMSTTELLRNIANQLEGKPIDIIFTSCYGGVVTEQARNILPPGSTLFAMNSHPVYLHQLEDMLETIRENDHLISITAENVMMTYLATVPMPSEFSQVGVVNQALSLEPILNRPSISSPLSTRSLHDKLISHLGYEFTDSEVALIRRHLCTLVDEIKLNTVMDLIVESNSFDNKAFGDHYGLALAICHAASGEILIPNQSAQEISSITTLDSVAPTFINHFQDNARISEELFESTLALSERFHIRRKIM